MAQSNARLTGDQEDTGLIPPSPATFVEIDHEIFFTVILTLSLIQEGQLSVSGERMCTSTCQLLRGLGLPGKMWLDKLTTFDVTLTG